MIPPVRADYKRDWNHANRGRIHRENQRPPAGCLPVTCWCERTVVFVPEKEIVVGLTRSCGLKACKAAA